MSDPRLTGAPGEIRTPDLLLRRQSLYPAELRARLQKLYTPDVASFAGTDSRRRIVNPHGE